MYFVSLFVSYPTTDNFLKFQSISWVPIIVERIWVCVPLNIRFAEFHVPSARVLAKTDRGFDVSPISGKTFHSFFTSLAWNADFYVGIDVFVNWVPITIRYSDKFLVPE